MAQSLFPFLFWLLFASQFLEPALSFSNSNEEQETHNIIQRSLNADVATDEHPPVNQSNTSTNLTTTNLTATTSDTRRRDLQFLGGIWEIDEPTITWQNFRLTLTYELNDAIEMDDIKFHIFGDGRCSRDLSAGNFLRFDVTHDDTTPTGDGSGGTRIVKVTIRIDPSTASNSNIVVSTGGRSVVSFCARLSLFDDQFFGAEPANVLNTQLAVIVIFNDNDNDNQGIQGLIPNVETDWGIDVYQCNKTGHNIEDYYDTTTSLEPKITITQGQKMRLCIGVNNRTYFDGIRMLSIGRVRYERGEVFQEAIGEGGRSGDDGLSVMRCEQGSRYCMVVSTLKNAFFTSPGIVEVSGFVNLQFGVAETEERRLLRAGFRLQPRQLYFVGEFVGDYSISHGIDVAPSSETFWAEAYRCNRFDEPFVADIPTKADEPVRICFRPDEAARKAGVYMRSVDSFKFTRDGTVQPAILDGGEPASDGNSLLVCSRGNPVCSLKTDLEASFFIRDGSIYGSGEVTLQFGTDTSTGIEVRRAQIRVLQEGDTATATSGQGLDPGFAGTSSVDVEFAAAVSSDFRANPSLWWGRAPPYLRVLYVAGFVVAAAFLCCCCWGFFGKRSDRVNKLLGVAVEGNPEGSIDAFIDSRASFYTDLDFATDASDHSSDEETITEHFEDDLEQQVAILFPRNPDPEDLSRPSAHGQRQLTNRLSVSDHGPSRYPPVGDFCQKRPSQLRSAPQRPPPPPGHVRGRGQGDRLSKSDHGYDRVMRGGPGRGRGGGPGRFDRSWNGGPPPPQPSGNGMSSSDHGPSRMGRGAGRGHRVPPHGRTTGMTGPRQHEGGMTQVPRLTPTSMRGSHLAPTSMRGSNNLAPTSMRGDSMALPGAGGQKMAINPRPSGGAGGSAPQVPRRPPSMGIIYDEGDSEEDEEIIQKPKMKAKKPNNNKKGNAATATTTTNNNNNTGKGKSNNDGEDNDKTKKKTSKSGGDEDRLVSKGSTHHTRSSNAHSTGVSSVESSLDDDDDDDESGNEEDDSDDGIPDEDDVCFEAEEHPGTEAFSKAVRKTIKKLGPVAYSPKIYRSIKKKLPGRRFFVCDDDDNPYDWREVSKSELIDLVWKYYEEEKAAMAKKDTKGTSS